MNAKLLAAGLACIIITACSKDKFNTRPTLEFKSLNGSDFPAQSDVKFQFTVTDKEGDIQDTMWVQKLSFVCPNVTANESGNFTQFYLIPDFTSTKNLKVELDINFTYGSNSAGSYPIVSGCNQRDDSCYFRFWLKDKGGNVSDTVTSPTIKLLKG